MPQPAQRVVRRFVWIALAVSIVLTGAILTAPQEAIAAPCCSACDFRLERCESGCGGDPGCLDACFESVKTCYNVCIFCW